jgi:hypothetical protein
MLSFPFKTTNCNIVSVYSLGSCYTSLPYNVDCIVTLTKFVAENRLKRSKEGPQKFYTIIDLSDLRYADIERDKSKSMAIMERWFSL